MTNRELSQDFSRLSVEHTDEEKNLEMKVEDTRRIVFCFVDETMYGETNYFCPVCDYGIKFRTLNRFLDHMSSHYPVELIDN